MPVTDAVQARASSRLGRIVFWVSLSGVVAIIALDQLTALLALALLVGLTWLAIVAPLATFVVGLALYAAPLAIQATNLVTPDIGAIYAGVRPLDIVLAAMLGAAVIRALGAWRAVPRFSRQVIAAGAVLWSILILEVLRNLGTYGVSAPGEFRSRFLILAVPAFVGLCLTSEPHRRIAAKLLFAVSVPYVLLVTPFIGVVKGWGIGPESRFLPAASALGMIYGLIWMLVARGEKVVRVAPTMVVLLLVPCIGLLFADSHRSVWLATIAIVGVLIVTKEIRLGRSWMWFVAGVLLLIGIVAAVSAAAGISWIDYVATRLKAVTDPLQDQTAAWRIYVWEAQLAGIKAHPIVGQGFGGYFDAYVPELDQRTDIFPHSLYVLSAVKLGLVGLGVLLFTGYAAVRTMWRKLGTLEAPGPDRVSVLMGLIALVALATYGVAYAWDFFSLAWMGLGLSACFWTAWEPTKTNLPEELGA
jgi:O-antigen ligase